MPSNVVRKWEASWCGSCKQLEPLLVKVAKEFDVEVEAVDIEAEGEMARENNIRSLPTLHFLADGQLTLARPGAGNVTEANLREMFQQAFGGNDEG